MSAFKNVNGKLNIKSILFYAVCAAVCVVSCVVLFRLNITHTVALEQEIRCGIEEHTHLDSCYNGDFLVCKKLSHTHNGNCYIVLLRDNDINEILTLIGNSGYHSLEHVINDTMASALNFNSNINSVGSLGGVKDLLLNQDTVSELNDTISNEDELPNIILNENINTPQAVGNSQNSTGNNTQNSTGETEQNPIVKAPVTMDVTQTPDTSNYNANFFIYLDGTWTCIGTLPYSTTQSGSRYNYTIPTADVLNLVNGTLGTDYEYNSFDISVATSQNGSYTTSNVGMQSVTTTIAYNQRSNASKGARYIRLIPSNGSASSTAFSFYTVTYQYPDQSIGSQVVRSGTAVTLPQGNYQWKNGSKTYAAGEAVTITAKTTFTAELIGPVTFVSVNYDLAFPSVSGVTVETKPTIAGLSVTTVTDGFAEGGSAVIRNVSQQSVIAKVNNNGTGLSRVIQFRGWKVGNSDVVLSPNTTIVWEEILNYAQGASLNLTAIWEYSPLQTASFFIRFDSVAVDTNGNITNQDSNRYTSELFAAYVGGVDTSLSTGTLTDRYGIADVSADNSYTADQSIRALYGENTEGVWLSSFPTDNQIFADLVQYANTGYLSVDGVAVKAEDLNDREYAIRWYVFKSQSDAWHIDGRLIRKEGLIYVYKTFAGNKELISKAKEGFYIDAVNTDKGTKTVLDLKNYKSYDPLTDTYRWEITNVEHGEFWELIEYPHLVNNNQNEEKYSVYADYRIIDALGDQSRSGEGSALSVNGMTYALDNGDDGVMKVEFTNIYNKSNSIVIKKRDALTGVSIGGATFRLVQNSVPLSFDYNELTGSYEYNPVNGEHTVLSGNDNGYFEISIQNFSYDLGSIVVQEVTAPTGYSPIGNIEIGYVDQEHTIGIVGGNSQMIKYVDGILIVGNSTDIMSVTVKKEWDCPENEWQPVTVQLLANKKLVTSVIAGVQPQVVLSAENGWQYKWINLPVYVNGEKIQWSVKETMVGTESAKSDGSFVNWLVSYSIPIQSVDENGDPSVLLSLTNTTKRVMLRLTKTDMTKSELLKGAGFLLEAVDSEGYLIPYEVAKTATTSDAGTLIFDNLKCGVRYRLTEQTAPQGYLELSEYVYFTINEDGSVAVEESYFAEAGGTAYNIIIRNVQAIPLPESGSIGSDMFYASGFALIALAFGICIYHLFKRRCYNE